MSCYDWARTTRRWCHRRGFRWICWSTSTIILNANSIAKPHAIDQLSVELGSYNIDVAVITETHLKARHSPSLIKIDGYNIIRRDRLKRQRGDVAVIARCEYPATEIVMEGDVREHEILWVQILMPRGYVVVGALYHPPKPIYPTDGLLQQLESNVETISGDFPDSLIILAGDLNSLSDSQVVQANGLVYLWSINRRVALQSWTGCMYRRRVIRCSRVLSSVVKRLLWRC